MIKLPYTSLKLLIDYKSQLIKCKIPPALLKFHCLNANRLNILLLKRSLTLLVTFKIVFYYLPEVIIENFSKIKCGNNKKRQIGRLFF